MQASLPLEFSQILGKVRKDTRAIKFDLGDPKPQQANLVVNKIYKIPLNNYLSSLVMIHIIPMLEYQTQDYESFGRSKSTVVSCKLLLRL
jgi:hypothetical protein